MGPLVINRANNRFSVLDTDGIVLEDVSKEAVEDYFVAEFRKRFWTMCRPVTMNELEYKTAAGKIVCCDCGQKVTQYNPQWKEANQRCEACKH
jgi:hypothetical protein